VKTNVSFISLCFNFSYSLTSAVKMFSSFSLKKKKKNPCVCFPSLLRHLPISAFLCDYLLWQLLVFPVECARFSCFALLLWTYCRLIQKLCHFPLYISKDKKKIIWMLVAEFRGTIIFLWVISELLGFLDSSVGKESATQETLVGY